MIPASIHSDPIKGANAERSRSANRQAVLGRIQSAGQMGRAEIARTLGLSTQAVSNIIADLTRDGLLVETGTRSVGRGLPAVQYSVNAKGGYAMGVEIHQQTAVQSLVRGPDGAILGVQTNRGMVQANKVVVAVSGHTTTLTETAGLTLPLRTMNLTAFVSEPVKPLVDVIVNCPDSGFYFSQSDKGEMVIGGAPDMGQSFRRDIKQAVFEDTVTAMLSLFPSFKKLKLLRQWGGHLDIAHDASPIMSATDVGGLFVTAGWWGGYKAIPAGGLTLAHLVARGEPHPLMAAFTLNRFRHLDFVLESGTTTAR